MADHEIEMVQPVTGSARMPFDHPSTGAPVDTVVWLRTERAGPANGRGRPGGAAIDAVQSVAAGESEIRAPMAGGSR